MKIEKHRLQDFSVSLPAVLASRQRNINKYFITHVRKSSNRQFSNFGWRKSYTFLCREQRFSKTKLELQGIFFFFSYWTPHHLNWFFGNQFLLHLKENVFSVKHRTIQGFQHITNYWKYGRGWYFNSDISIGLITLRRKTRRRWLLPIP